MPVDVAARIVSHQALNPDHFLLTLEAKAIAASARPGQFVMLQVDQGCYPLLRRPMSICRVPVGRAGHIEILYKVTGEGTRRLARHPAGSRLLVLGPLGRGFRLPRAGKAGGPVLMVAGGVGIAIFPFLAEALRRRRVTPTLLYGARSAADLVALAKFRSLGIRARFATEDGSRGLRGYVTGLMQPYLLPGQPKPWVFACGPTAMLAGVGRIAEEAGVPCQLALESQMPCGIGVCLGCVVRCRTESDGIGSAGTPVYRRVCTEGPVFEASAVSL